MKLLPAILIVLGLVIGLLGFSIGGGYGHGNEGARRGLEQTAKGLASLTDEQLRAVWPDWVERPGDRSERIGQRLGLPWLGAVNQGAVGIILSSLGLGFVLIVLGITEAVFRRDARGRTTA